MFCLPIPPCEDLSESNSFCTSRGGGPHEVNACIDEMWWWGGFAAKLQKPQAPLPAQHFNRPGERELDTLFPHLVAPDIAELPDLRIGDNFTF